VINIPGQCLRAYVPSMFMRIAMPRLGITAKRRNNKLLFAPRMHKSHHILFMRISYAVSFVLASEIAKSKSPQLRCRPGSTLMVEMKGPYSHHSVTSHDPAVSGHGGTMLSMGTVAARLGNWISQPRGRVNWKASLYREREGHACKAFSKFNFPLMRGQEDHASLES